MGPTLAVLAKRAAEAVGYRLEVVGVSRFTDNRVRTWLEEREVRTLGCDLLDPAALAALPETANLVHLVGLKFGSAQNPDATWAVNTVVPGNVVRRYPEARMALVSTGNVYPLMPVESGGAPEAQTLHPVGEYARSAVAREQVFQHHAEEAGAPVVILRLNYAIDLRYGVLRDIAARVWEGQPVDLTNGHFNCIWQGDANEMILRALELASSPANVLNLTGPDTLSVREVAVGLGRMLEREPRFAGTEAATALLSNASRLCELLGPPRTTIEALLRWTAAWVQGGGRTLNKPTHFEVRDGRY